MTTRHEHEVRLKAEEQEYQRNCCKTNFFQLHKPDCKVAIDKAKEDARQELREKQEKALGKKTAVFLDPASDKSSSLNPFKGTKWQPKPTDTPPAAIDAVAAKAAERREALLARRGTTLDRDALTDRLVALAAHDVHEHGTSSPFIRKLASYFSVLDLKAIIEELDKK